MRVLLVDDETKFVTMLARRLDLRGIRADFVFTGADAITLVEKGERFDVAVLDVKMPGIGGIELRRKLSELNPDMRFVFLTGHGSNIDYDVGAAEAACYLPKPLKIEDLIETLNKVTEGRCETGTNGV